MSLALRNVLFTLVVPGAGALGIPWWIQTRAWATAPVAWQRGTRGWMRADSWR
jgi:hypothetical protein